MNKDMKKTIMSLLALCTLCGVASAQTVTVSDVEALPGETVAFSLSLQGGKADTYISLQFDVNFPSTGFSTTGDYTLSGQWKNAMSVVGDVDASGVATIPVSSAETITGSDVDNLLMVFFTVADDVALGDYDVTLSGITFGYNMTDKDVAPDVTFTVHVVEAHTIVLDENAATMPEDAEGVNVRVLRTIQAGKWSTICLPFAMTEVQVKTAFGNDVELADFTSWSSEEDDDGDIVSISIGFTNVTELEANHPYIIRTGTDISGFSLEGVDIEVDEEPMVQVGKKKAERGFFTGTYTANTLVPEYNLFLSDNKFWYSTGLTKMKAFRGYFELYDVLTEVESAGSRITLSFDGEVTGIRKSPETLAPVESEPMGKLYDLQGRMVNRQSLVNGQLKKGVYIRNGRTTGIRKSPKIVIK